MDDRSCERLRNLLHDVEAIKRACSEDKNCPFMEFEYSDYLFRFEYQSKSEKRFYWVNLSEDYPNGSVLTWTINGSDSNQGMKTFDLPLPFVFNSVAKELYREIAIPVLCPVKSSLAMETFRQTKKDDDDDDYEDGSNCDEDEEFNENNYYEEDRNTCMIDNLEVLGQGHEELREDFDLLRSHCPEAQMHEIPSLDEVEIAIPLSTSFLEDELARAWRLKPKTPIYLRLFFSYTKYCEEPSSTRVEIFQEKHEKIVAGVLIQLTGILTNFVKTSVEALVSQRTENPKFKKSKKSPPKQPLCPPKSKVARLSTSQTIQPDSSKSPPSLGQGLLVEIFYYAQQRLQTLNDYCVICDELHTFTNSAMLKPMVCDRALCVFSYQTLGVMSSVADDIAIETGVVDLLIAMAKAACVSSRCDIIFDPYPTVVNPGKPQEFMFSPDNKKQTIEHVRQVMDKFIPMEAMTRMLGVELKTQLDTSDKLIYPLLQWIISSNRSHIVSLKPIQRFSFMKTPHQFLLRSSPPAKEAAFNQAREIHGSVFAFHGSSIENWHSILRKGLINASGTALQLNGAAFGKGIYLSPEASLSFNYSNYSRSFSRATPTLKSTAQSRTPYSGTSLHLLPPHGIICIALCEVVASKTLKKMSSQIWVMPDEDYVVTRFLFVFEDAQNLSLRSDDPKVLAEIRRALS